MVLTDISDVDSPSARDLFYIGLTRSVQRLVVVRVRAGFRTTLQTSADLMSTATDPIADRRRMLRVLRDEVLGPAATGRVLPDGHPLEFDNLDEFYGPHHPGRQPERGRQGGKPAAACYGAGILFPAGSQVKTKPVDPEQAGTAADEATKEAAAELLSENARKKLEAAAERTRTGGTTEQEGDEVGITLANEFRPSSTGLSFLASLPPSAALRVRVKAGRYRSRPANLRKPDGKLVTANWWFRSLVVVDAMFSGDQLRESSGLLAPLAVKARNRPRSESGHKDPFAATARTGGVRPRRAAC